MSRVIFMCGPSGSGKTMYAKRLEGEGMVRLSIDAEMWRRGIADVLHLPAQARAEIEAHLHERLLQLVADGRDVVLDFSFWSRAMRDRWRQALEPTGVVPETIYLATPRAIALRRLQGRQGAHSDDYVIPDDLAARYIDQFEVPTPDGSWASEVPVHSADHGERTFPASSDLSSDTSSDCRPTDK